MTDTRARAHLAPVAAVPATRRELRSLERSGRRGRGRRRVAARPPAPRKSIRQRFFSAGILLLCGALFVGLTVPANALHSEGGGAAPMSVTAEPVQYLAVGADAVVEDARHDGYDVVSWAEVLRQKYGSNTASYTVDNTGPIRWPFPFPVPISDGYGDRVSPCRGCSSSHQGIDFVPGAGQPVYVVADGVVTLHEEDDWSYGNTVEIEHQIDGHIVTSKYAHLQTGSSPLKAGDQVRVADFLGLVGDTGATTGPHLHFEIWIDGQKVNPFTWLQHYAG